MIVVAIVGVVFAGLAVCGVLLDSQDPYELRDMGVQLDREPIDRALITEPQPQPRAVRRRRIRIKRARHTRSQAAHVVHHA